MLKALCSCPALSRLCGVSLMSGYLEGDGQSFVAAPVRGQHRAQEVGTVGAHELSGVLGKDLHAAVTHA